MAHENAQTRKFIVFMGNLFSMKLTTINFHGP